jgi:hypothetical protein
MSYLSSVKYLQCNNFKFRSGVLAWSVRVEYGVVLWSVEWTFCSHKDEKYQVFTAKYASRVKNCVSHAESEISDRNLWVDSHLKAKYQDSHMEATCKG